MMRPSGYIVETLGKVHDRHSFTCGEPTLDTYLERQAGQDVKRDLAICYVLTQGTPTIIGYYTLSAYAVQFSALPADVAKTSGRYEYIPAVLLGRLAISQSFQHQGLGTLLLLNAMRRILRTSIGVKLVIVDALHDGAVRFYEAFEFKRFIDMPNRLYLPTSKIRDIFPEDASAEHTTPNDQ